MGTGVVSEVGLKKVDKIRARELSAFCDGSTYQFDAYCPVCIMNWYSVEAAKSCDCVHSGARFCWILEYLLRKTTETLFSIVINQSSQYLGEVYSVLPCSFYNLLTTMNIISE